MLTELRGYLGTAERATAEDAGSRRRIAFLRRGLDLTEIEAAAHRLLRQTELNADEKAEARRLLDRRWVMMRKIFEEEHYAVNVAAVLQSESQRFSPLGWKGPSPAAKASVAAAPVSN